MISASLSQVAFRFRNDDGSEIAATWKATENTDITAGVDENIRLRVVIEETAGGSENRSFQLQYNHNGAGYVSVTGSSAVVQASLSSHFAEDDPTTDQIGGAGTFRTGRMSEDDGLPPTQASFSGSDHTEYEFCFRILSVDVVNNDTIDFRVIRNTGSALESYTQTPTITVSEGAAADHAIARIHAFRGVRTSGNPWNITSGNVEAASDTSLSATGATTTAADCLVCIMAAIMDDAQDFGATWTNADLANITVRQNSPGISGNDGRHILVTGEKASTGAYGATTNTLTASSVKAMMTIALEGAPNVHNGSGAASVSLPAIAASGLLAFIGSAALAVAQPAVAGTGAMLTSRVGSGALAVSQPAIAATGQLVFTGSGALLVTPPAIAASATQFPNITATGALTVGPPSLAGTGTITQASVTGTGALTVVAPALAASGVQVFDGSGAASVTAPSVAGTGAQAFVGDGSLAVATSIAGSGTQEFAATGALAVSVSVAGTGFIDVEITGSGALDVTAPSIAGVGEQVFAGTGAASVTAPTIAGSGLESFDGTGSLSVTASIAGSGALEFVGTGALLVPQPVISGGEEDSALGVVAVHSATVAIVDTDTGTASIQRRHGTSIMDTYTADNGTGTADNDHYTADDAPMRYV